MIDSTRTSTKCATCMNIGTNKCAGRGAMQCCLKTCQKADWSVHKLLFKTFAAGFKTALRLGSDYYWDIFFAIDDDQPRLHWLHVTRNLDAEFEDDIVHVLSDPTDFRSEEGFNNNAVFLGPLNKIIVTRFRMRDCQKGCVETYG
jgi:hypothetical protein